MPGIHENNNLWPIVSGSHKSAEVSLEIIHMKDWVDKNSKHIYIMNSMLLRKKTYFGKVKLYWKDPKYISTDAI